MPDSSMITIVSADFIYVDHVLRSGWGMAVDAGGTIVEIGRLETLPAGSTRHYRGCALFPGFVNTHSHAFQRLIRGRTLTVPAENPRADFWSWRTRMYEAALALEPEDFATVTAFCYLEMLRAGITSVAEFHYVHHDRDGRPYADPNTLAWAVLEAARRVGLRVTLLPVAYHRGGFDRPAEAAQRRFLFADSDAFLRQLEALHRGLSSERRIDGSAPRVGLGVAAHSVRAVPEAWLSPLKAWARSHGLPAHVHANEQRAEVEQCLAATGVRPTELLARAGFLDRQTVVVHATHLSAREKALLARHGSMVSVCPTTERDLGDGILDASGLRSRGVPLSLGSDSQVQIDFFAEMRCLEGHERLRRRRRNVLVAGEDASAAGGKRDTSDADAGAASGGAGERSVSPTLWEAATSAGAKALELPVGRFAPGLAADGFTIDLGALTLEGATPAEIPGMLICGGTPGLVQDVLVGGVPVLGGGAHGAEEGIRSEFRALCRRLWS